MQSFRRTVNDRFDSADIGSPSLIGSSVGMAHLITKEQTFLTDITFRHDKNPPSDITRIFYQKPILNASIIFICFEVLLVSYEFHEDSVQFCPDRQL